MKPFRKFSQALLAAIVVPVALGACGSSSKPASPTSTWTTAAPSSTTATTVAPTVPRWTAIPAAPIAGRIAAGAVWTGHEMIVWGGVARPDGTATAASDGAAYDPATRTWRALASPPAGVLGDTGDAAVWTGDRALFWAGNAPDGPAVGATYDPATDRWQQVPRGPLGAREGYASAWTGRELVVVGGTSGDQFASPVAAALNPATGAWRQLHAFDALPGLRLSHAVVVGGRVYGTGIVSDCPELGSSCRREHAIFLSYDPATNALQQIDLAHAPSGSLVTVGATASAVVFSVTNNDSLRIARYDVTTHDWTVGPPTECAPVRPAYSQTAWLSGSGTFVAGCGASQLAVYRVATGRWTTLDAGASPLNSFADSAIVWTGRQLVVWSGTVALPGNPAPNTGAIITLG